MKVNAAAIGAVTLGSSVMAQSAPPPVKGPVGTTDLLDLKALGEWTLDACHKVDSAFDGFIWPCASQLKTNVKLCPTSANTEEERIAQRDCLCGEGSSYVQDAVACSECKVQNGLQPDIQRDHWKKYYEVFDEKYCKAKEVPLNFDAFREKLSQDMPVPEGGRNFNQHQKVTDPRIYYGDNVPKRQGAAQAAPVVDNSKKDDSVPAVVDPVAGQVKVPVYVAISELPAASENKTEQAIKSTTSAPFRNGTATIKATSSLPSTFLTVTTSSLSGSPTTTLLPSSSVVPAPGSAPGPVEEHIIVIAGKPCVVYVVWIIVDCTPKTDAAGNFAIDYQTVGVDKKEPAVMLENNDQFNKIKGAIPDAGKDQKLADDVKKHVGTASPVVPAPAAGKNENLPPVKGSTGQTKTVNDETECEVVDGVPPGKTGSTPVKTDGKTGSTPVKTDETGNTPVKTDGKTGETGNTPVKTDGKTGETGNTPVKTDGKTGETGNTPVKTDGKTGETGNTPVKTDGKTGKTGSTPVKTDGKTGETGNTPVKTDGKTGSTPVKTDGTTPGSNTCECPTSALSTSSDRDAADICKKKVATEDRCKAMSGDEAKKQCYCSSSFFDEAIICARRSGEVRQSEFEAQILFETKFRFCKDDSTFGSDLYKAYQNVEGEWREARNPHTHLV